MPSSDASDSADEAAAALRNALADKLKGWDVIRTAEVETAFREVSRHLFLPGEDLEMVYSDQAIVTKQDGDHPDSAPISSSSQPAIMAIMLEQLGLELGHRVLEIGAGTGYNAALMAHIVGGEGRVVTLDIDDDIVADARKHIAAAGLDNVTVVRSDGGYGYPPEAPYDRIILTVGAWDIAPAWLKQLKPDGRMVLPLSTRGGYQLSVAFERQNGHLESTSVKPCGFMLLRGAFASPEHHLPLEPGFSLDVVEKPKLDADGVWLLLTGESSDVATGVSVSPAESGFGGLGRWLSLHLPGMCTLTAQGDAVELGIVPCLFGYGKDPKFCHTRGSINETSLAVLARGAPPPDSESSESFELVVRTYGPDPTPAELVMEQVKAWDAAGRPDILGLKVKALPIESPYTPAKTEAVIPKKSSLIVVGWE